MCIRLYNMKHHIDFSGEYNKKMVLNFNILKGIGKEKENILLHSPQYFAVTLNDSHFSLQHEFLGQDEHGSPSLYICLPTMFPLDNF